jgi:putative Ca2+/H+ antiporter (TMEM165/GDT1 family)
MQPVKTKVTLTFEEYWDWWRWGVVIGFVAGCIVSSGLAVYLGVI